MVGKSSSQTVELLIVSTRGVDDPWMLSLASQLLENGICFAFDEQRNDSSTLPDSFANHRALLLDEESLQCVRRDKEAMRRLEEYVNRGGFLFKFKPAQGLENTTGINLRTIIDAETSYLVQEMISQASLLRFHPSLETQQLLRSDEEILSELKEALLNKLRRLRRWNEFALHYWKSAIRLSESGAHSEVSAILSRAIRETCAKPNHGFDGNALAGLFGPVWLHRQTGESSLLESTRKILDRVIEQRPRNMEVLTFSGFSDDPLGRQTGGAGDWHWMSGRDIVRTETLHFCGAVFAGMTRATGDPRYLDEALKLVEHCGLYHLDQDGLLFHATRDGQPVAPKWCRGQSHALYGMLYILEEMEPSDPRCHRIIDLIRRLGCGLREHQDARTGLWRNLVNQPLSRLEGSGSAAFVYVYGRCIREGWLKADEFGGMVQHGRRGLKRLYWRKGLASNCRCTDVGTEESYYLSRPHGWGETPQLLMALL